MGRVRAVLAAAAIVGAALSGRARAGAGKADPADVSPTVKLTLRKDFHPNPAVIDGQHATAASKMDLESTMHRKNCQGYIPTTPALELEIPDGLENVEISATGGSVIYAEFAGKYVCDYSTQGDAPVKVRMKEWPPGKVTVYVGYVTFGESYRYGLRIEDTARKVDTGWKDDLPTLTVKEPPKAPLLLAGTALHSSTHPATTRCEGMSYSKDPDAMIVLDRPLTEMVLSVRSPRHVRLMVLGPISDDGRRMPGGCLRDDTDWKWGRVEAGKYAVFIGTDEKDAPARYTLIFRGQKTPRAPLEPAAEIPDHVPVGERALVNHFPQLDLEDVWASDANREALFMRAPRSLFLYPKFDLDEGTARWEGRLGFLSTETQPPEGTKLEFPRKDEPLLSIDGRYYLSADGNLFTISAQDLTGNPSGGAGKVALPTKVRDAGLSFPYSLNAAGPEDGKAIAAWKSAEDAYGRCADKIWEGPNHQIASIKNGPYHDSNEDRIRSIESTTREKEARACGFAAVNAKQQALWKELIRTRTARRQAMLGRVGKHLAELFAGGGGE